MSAPESREQSPPASAADKPAKSKRRRSARRRHLVIVESPAKAETIARFLGDDYVVDASYGHVRDLPSTAEERPDSIKGQPWAELGVNVEEDFAPVYIVPADKRPHVKRLQQILKGADKLLLATDEDREGESIGWHLIELLAPSVPVERIVFHEVTPEAIVQALRSPRQVDRNLVEAQESRRILDRLFGYSLSPVLWRKIQVGLSAGRVQSVAVRLLVERERERARFRAATYWDAEATLESAQGSLPATLKRLGQERLPTTRDFDPASGALTAAGVRLLDEAQVADLIEALRAAEPWNVTSVETSPHRQRPAPPFTTSTLQQEASHKLGFSARRTMQVAQSLYEGVDVGSEREGLITYMRTDSVTLAKPVLTELQDLIREQFGAAYAGGSRAYRTRTRNAQEAHEAIRPTHVRRSPDVIRSALSEDQLRLYELVWRRTLASQMTDAQLERTVVEIQVPLTGAWAGDSPGLFEARGRRLVFAGYLHVAAAETNDPDAEDESERLLPAVAEGESVRLAALEAKRHQTQPPPRFTEASLVRRLEEEGLGRPSTYAAILSTIQDRGYAFRQGNALVPSFLAYAVTELLERHFGDSGRTALHRPDGGGARRHRAGRERLPFAPACLLSRQRRRARAGGPHRHRIARHRLSHAGHWRRPRKRRSHRRAHRPLRAVPPARRRRTRQHGLAAAGPAARRARHGPGTRTARRQCRGAPQPGTRSRYGPGGRPAPRPLRALRPAGTQPLGRRQERAAAATRIRAPRREPG